MPWEADRNLGADAITDWVAARCVYESHKRHEDRFDLHLVFLARSGPRRKSHNALYPTFDLGQFNGLQGAFVNAAVIACRGPVFAPRIFLPSLSRYFPLRTAGQDNAHVDEFGTGICEPVKWPIVADARLAAKADIDIAQTHKKCGLQVIQSRLN